MISSLSKYIAHAGVCSRRNAVDLIKQGAVTVNGHLITEPGHKVEQVDVVKVNNKVIKQEAKTYILLNKPKDHITSVSDDRGRKTVMDLIAGQVRGRLFPVGRLDRMTTGLLILTNDGDLAERLAHPRNEVKKVYQIMLSTPLKEEDIAEIRRGVTLSDGRVFVDAIKRVPTTDNSAFVTLHSGKYRVVRRLFESFGYLVKKLSRIEFAGLTTKGLVISQWRFLTPKEVTALKKFGNASPAVMRKLSSRSKPSAVPQSNL
jgi:23S rRNA pseudouridine2605 synthase